MKNYKFESIRRNSRLKKYAILINEESGLSEIHNIIKYISCIWGGYETFIIPYSKTGIDGVFIKQLREFDPDYIFSWENKEIPNWIIDKVKKYTNPFLNIEGNIICTMQSYIDYPHVSTKYIYDKISSGLLRIENIENKDKNNKLYLALIALTGVIECEVPNLYKENIQNASLRLDEKYDSHYSTKYNRYYPFDLTLEGVDKYSYIHKYEKKAIFIVGDSLKEFCLYFNLSRYNDLVFWINEDTLQETYIQGIKDYFQYTQTNRQCKISHIISIDNDKKIDIVDKLGINTKSKIVEEMNFNQLINYEFIHDHFGIYNKIGNWEGVWFDDLNPIDNIQAQDFVGFEKEDSNKFRYFTEVEIKDFKPINKFYALNQKEKNLIGYRICKNGIVFESIRDKISMHDIKIENNLMNMKFNHESLFENISKLLNQSKKTLGISNQGQYAFKVLNKFDNDIGLLSEYINNSNYKNIFDKYIDSDKNNKIGIVLRDRRRYFTYENICEITSDKIAQEFINDMVRRNVIKRGYLVKCNECSHAFWISLNNIKENITCNQCDCNLFYTYDLSRFGEVGFEPKIYYKLDEIFFHAWNNDFYVPILALNYFRNQSKEYFNHMNEVDVYDEEGKKFGEIDFICNVDGRLIIGECKKNNEIDDKQVGKYVALAISCGFDEVVLVTLKEWSDTSKDMFAKREDDLNKQGIKLILLEEDDLI